MTAGSSPTRIEVETPPVTARRLSVQRHQLRRLGFFQASRDSVLLPAHRLLSVSWPIQFQATSRPLKNIAGREIGFHGTALYAPYNHTDASIATLEGVLDPMRRTAHDRFRLNCPSGSRSVPPTSSDRRFRLSPQDCDRIVTLFRMKPVLDDREFGVLVSGRRVIQRLNGSIH